LVQEKLEGLRAQYVELVATSNHATRSLEEALQLATHFEAAHGELDDALGYLEAGLYDYDEAEACGVEPTSGSAIFVEELGTEDGLERAVGHLGCASCKHLVE